MNMKLPRCDDFCERLPRRLRTVVAAAPFTLLLALAPLQAEAAEGPLVVNYSLPPATLDPARVCDISDNGFISSLYVTLLQYAEKPIEGAPAGITATREDTTRFEGYLAESWEVSPDGKTLSFKIREGVTFPSGRPVDANAVKASLTRALKSGACGTYFMEAAQFGNTQSIEAPDASTVVITLAVSEPLVLHALTQPNSGIVDVVLVEEMGGDEWLASNSAGSGPYVLKEYSAGVRATFAANPTFFGAQPPESEVVVNFITDDSTLLLQARNGNADVTLGLSKRSVSSLLDREGLQVVKVGTARWPLIGLPNDVPPFDNRKVREALSYAVPYEQILKSVAFGFGELYFGPFPPAFPAFNPALGAPRKFDMDRAKALIEESGASLPVQIDLVIREGANDHEQIATIVQSMWKQLGVDITIRKLPAAAYQEVIFAETKKTLLIRFDGPSVQDPAWLLDYDLRCASNFNTSDYCNSEAEDLLNKAHPIADIGERQALWDQIAKIWIEDTPRIPLYADTYTAVLKDGVKRWYYTQDGPFELQRWSH